MTQQTPMHRQTSRHEMPHQQKPSHHPKNDAQSSYQPTTKIKNCSTHLGITIRWVEEPPQFGHGELILESASGDLVGVVG